MSDLNIVRIGIQPWSDEADLISLVANKVPYVFSQVPVLESPLCLSENCQST